jgi:hypothetical protein
MVDGAVFLMIGIWVVIKRVFWPLIISKALLSGGGHALSRISESVSPVITASQQATNVAKTVVSGTAVRQVVQVWHRGLSVHQKCKSKGDA